MSHDPGAVEAIAQFVAGEVFGDGAEPTELIVLQAGDLLDALAAAGYTVTRDRYEPARWWESEAGHRVFGIAPAPGDNAAPLYRKIEGSTDGADRD